MKIIQCNKYYIIIFCILIYIIIETNLKNGYLQKLLFYIEEKDIYHMFFVFYKGKKILKTKLVGDYLSLVSDEYYIDKRNEKQKLDKYFNLLYYNNDISTKIFLKNKLLNYISLLKKKSINQISTIFLNSNIYFGNGIIRINNCIFYCEILGCRTIILNSKETSKRWLIARTIFIEKLNITITQSSNVNCAKDEILCLHEVQWEIYYPTIIIPQVRIHLVKEEILRNLPHVDVNNNSLYIHIRGGNVWGNKPHHGYGQPPLCFYERIIKTNHFQNIYLVSMDKKNVIVNELLNKYKNIIHNVNNVEYDISLLSHAFNMVAATSTFSMSSIKLNDNLKNLWEFDSIKLSEKIFFLHHHLYKMQINYKIYTMKPSNTYISEMFSWKKNNKQIKLMLEDNCPNDFVVTKPIVNN